MNSDDFKDLEQSLSEALEHETEQRQDLKVSRVYVDEQGNVITILEGECDLNDDLPEEIDFSEMKVDWERTRRLRERARKLKEGKG